MESNNSPTSGEWVVHPYHGIGQLMGKKTMHISGKDSIYFRLEIDNGSVFIPEDQIGGDTFRPVASKKTIQEMINILARPAKEMDSNGYVRKNQIDKVIKENSILGLARIIRDLKGRRSDGKTLSANEESLLKKLHKRLISEWAIATGLDEDEAKKKLKALMDRKV